MTDPWPGYEYADEYFDPREFYEDEPPDDTQKTEAEFR